MEKKKPINIPPSQPFIIGTAIYEWTMELVEGKLKTRINKLGLVDFKKKK
jgi:hypothetical protein